MALLWEKAQAEERKRVTPDEAMIRSDVTVEAPLELVDRLMLEPAVMQRYLFSDDVVVIPGARGEDLGAEFHCHHGGSLVNLRLVSREPGRELTLFSDQPTDMYVTTRLRDEGGGRTSVSRSFIWDAPANPEIAEGVRQMMEAMAVAGEEAIKEVFEEKARAQRA
jgi:hypothetical protein